MKKMVIADNLAVQVDAVFSGDDVLLGNFFWVLWGAVCFGIQIYCDFSGYTDIAIGSARLFGIEIPENFDSPYIAKNFREFWRRWHISLSTWLRDYLYISLGGSRNGVLRMYVALMATMVLGGLWHGANWNFLLWGIAHGALLCGQRIIELGSFGELPRGKLASAASLLLTQYFVFLTWIIFRVSDVGVLVPSIKTFLHLGATYGFSEFWSSLPAGKFTAVLLMGIFIVSHVFGGLTCRNRNRFLESSWLTSLIAIVIMLTLVVLIQPPQPVTFIYFRF
jgi:alginate O-acetyltransferase complex protein AlgI